jgi:hypothetical protein
VDSPILLFAPPPTPCPSHGSYHDNRGNFQAQAQTLPLGPYVREFLQEHALEEKVGDSVSLIYNTPVPTWFKLVKSLDLTETQRGELITALTNDWSAGSEGVA